MKTTLTAVLAIALLSGAAQAQAQNQNGQGQDHKKNPPPPPAQNHPAPPPRTPPSVQRPVFNQPATTGPTYQHRSTGQPTGSGQPTTAGPTYRRYNGPNGQQTGAGPVGPNRAGAYQRGSAAASAFQAQRNRNRAQYNASQWRRSYNAERRFEGPRYRYPYGWRYQRWAFGEFLPFAWILPDYYLDAYTYGLPYPPFDAEWIREGSDAVLVDVSTGQILSVEYGLFY